MWFIFPPVDILDKSSIKDMARFPFVQRFIIKQQKLQGACIVYGGGMQINAVVHCCQPVLSSCISLVAAAAAIYSDFPSTKCVF